MPAVNPLDQATIAAVRQFFQLVQQHFDAQQVVLFGSRARGTHRTDSDADVAVLLTGKHGAVLPVKMQMADMAFDIMLETGILISPMPVWEDEWEQPSLHSNPDLLVNIQREGIRL